MDIFIQIKPVFIILHALAAAVGLGAVITTDALFFKFLKDFRVSKKESEILDTISKVIWAAIFVLFITGLVLYMSAPLDYLAKSKFIVKLVIFIGIVINGILLNATISPYLVKLSFNNDAKILHSSVRLRVMRRMAFASGAFSIISWLSVFILGSVRSIPLTTTQGLLGYIGLVFAVVSISQIFASFLKKK